MAELPSQAQVGANGKLTTEKNLPIVRSSFIMVKDGAEHSAKLDYLPVWQESGEIRHLWCANKPACFSNIASVHLLPPDRSEQPSGVVHTILEAVMGSSIRRNPTLVKINEEIGRNIHRTRTLLQLTQLDVGHIIDVRPQQIQKYESGKDAISAARLYLLSTYMKVPPANFFQSSHERPEWEEYVQDSETVSILMKLRYMPIEQKRALNAFLTLQMAGYL